MKEEPPGIDLKAALAILIRSYIKNHTLSVGLKVQYRSMSEVKQRIQNPNRVNAVVTSVGEGEWDDRMVMVLPEGEDQTEVEVHCSQIRVP